MRSCTIFWTNSLIGRTPIPKRAPRPIEPVIYGILSRLAMKQSKRFKLKLREFQMVLRGLVSTRHPLLAHIIPTRRCNLSCGYCNEYDDFSPPIGTDLMLRRIDLLAGLRTAAITLSGGEPLL